MRSLLYPEYGVAIVMAKKNHNFWSNRWIALKVLQEFMEAVFLRVAIESILGDGEVWLRETRVTAHKGPNFWSDRWITLKIL
jgi:hypothetical protein